MSFAFCRRASGASLGARQGLARPKAVAHGRIHARTARSHVVAAAGNGDTIIGEAAQYLKANVPQVNEAVEKLSAIRLPDASSLDQVQVLSKTRQLLAQLPGQLQNSLEKLDLDSAEQLAKTSVPDLQAAVNSVVASALQLQQDPDAVLAAWIAASVAVTGAGLMYMGSIQNSQEPIPQRYDVQKLNDYWSRRPLASFRRSSAVTAKLLGWVGRLLMDMQGGDAGIEKGASARAKELKDIISGQGPAFVKVGQAVAIRPDLLPPAYTLELQELLDQVQAFSRKEARELIEQELGQPLTTVFEDERDFDEPVAAASIGQVYKATLKAGPDGKPTTVAVKCQRPNILESVTLDILTMRGIAETIMKIPGSNPKIAQARMNAEQFISIIDVAAERFLEELDYVQEVANCVRFDGEMSKISAIDGMIKVPKMYNNYCSRYLMVSEWVDGKKLTQLAEDKSEEGRLQRKEVVTKLLYSYMVQLLETGYLHADPHPGNFLMMEDGRLCILDFGMMTEITEDQRISFVEYLAHLSAGQYDQTLDDLVRLGFVPAELGEDDEKRAIVGPVLANILETIYSTGGGMDTKVAMLAQNQKSQTAALSDTLEEISREYPLQLPPYFVLILRAFGTLEGLGLGVDSDFAVIDECFPYIARRLLSDDSPRVRQALRNFIYNGKDRLDVEKLEDVAKGFSQFTNTMDSETLEATAVATAKPMDAATRDLLSLMFSPEGNYLQELLIDEAVRAVDALSRDALVRVWQQLAASAPAAVALSLLPTPLGAPAAFVPGFNALPILSLLAARNTDAIALSAEDRANLDTLQRLARLVATVSSSAANPNPQGLTQQQLAAAQRQAREIVQLTGPGAASIAQRFAQRLGERLRQRIRTDATSLGLPSGSRAFS